MSPDSREAESVIWELDTASSCESGDEARVLQVQELKRPNLLKADNDC